MVDLQQNVIPNTKPALDLKPFQHQYCKKTTIYLVLNEYYFLQI